MPASVEQPQGTVSFLFSDIEGSTRLLQTLGSEQYADALAQHRLLLRRAFGGHNGYEVNCEGDEFFVAFESARDAIVAAADAQRALAAHAWPEEADLRVRIGIHTGQPLLAPPKYVGLDVHKAARLMAAAHGGQILVSRATRDLCDGEPSDGLTMRDLGEHRLKDLAEPEQLHQLIVSGLKEDFPPIRTLTATRIDLPAQPNRFVGRTREVAEVCADLGRERLRLLTLTGPGGSGKTRLALQAAAERAGSYGDGVRFVALGPVADPLLLVPTIAQTLGLVEQPGVEPAEVLSVYLAERELLLVLDNLEHLLAGVGVLGQLLSACPALQLLVTSREPLRLSAEYEYPVPPLDEHEAIELFHERARAVRRDFTANGEVAEICQRVDALPLAVELAAAHARSLSPAQILARLEARLSLLADGPRDAPDRQRTLRATIEWSHDLLSPDEQRLFRRVAAFAGGCALEAAETVCDADFHTLQALVEKSLVHRRADRYLMLETIREYALELLDADPDGALVRARHAAYYEDVAAGADAEVRGARSSEMLHRLERDHDNLRAALAWLLDQDPERALRLALCVETLWTLRGRIEEGTHWIAQVLERTRGSLSGARAHALREAASFAEMRGMTEEAQALGEQALEEATLVGDRREVAGSLLSLGRYDEALHEYRALGHDRGISAVYRELGLKALDAGRPSEARRFLEDAVAICRRLDIPWSTAGGLLGLGECALAERRLDAAGRFFTESLTMARALGFEMAMAEGVGAYATLSVVRGASELAAFLWGALEATEEALGFRIERRDRYERLVEEALRANPGALAEGRRLALPDAVAQALASVD